MKGYKMKYCEKHGRRYKQSCEDCMFEHLEEIDLLESRNQLLQESAKRFGCSPDDLPDEYLDTVEKNGWSVSLDGHPYCLNCGCQVSETLAQLAGRKRCGMCQNALGGT